MTEDVTGDRADDPDLEQVAVEAGEPSGGPGVEDAGDDLDDPSAVLDSREAFAATEPVPATGDPRVDDATALLADLPGLPTDEHADLYEDVHRRLQQALAGAAGSGPDA